MRYQLDAEGKKRVTVIAGDGIGPEVVAATRAILDATGVRIAWEEHEAGAEVFKRGLASGVPKETIASIKDTRVALKGPLETPVGFGEKSANVTLRKLFETFANVRPVREMPNVKTRYSGAGVDLVIVRENVEDLGGAPRRRPRSGRRVADVRRRREPGRSGDPRHDRVRRPATGGAKHPRLRTHRVSRPRRTDPGREPSNRGRAVPALARRQGDRRAAAGAPGRRAAGPLRRGRGRRIPLQLRERQAHAARRRGIRTARVGNVVERAR